MFAGLTGAPTNAEFTDDAKYILDDDRRLLTDALGQPMRSWDSRGQRFSHTYDPLRRPVDRTVSVDGGPETLLTRIVYGDLDDGAATNHRGRVYCAYDGAGAQHASTARGEASRASRRARSDKKNGRKITRSPRARGLRRSREPSARSSTEAARPPNVDPSGSADTFCSRGIIFEPAPEAKS